MIHLIAAIDPDFDASGPRLRAGEAMLAAAIAGLRGRERA
jgi:hypothetical protein